MSPQTIKQSLFVLAALTSMWCNLNQATAQVQWRTNLKQAALESQKTQKPMLLKVTADWCTFCHKMEDSYNTPKISKRINECFIPVKVDADKYKKLASAVGAERLPTSVIVSPEFKVGQKIVGYFPPKKLSTKLETICPAPSQQETQIAKETTQPAQAPIQQVSYQCAFEECCLVELIDNQKLVTGSSTFSTTFRGKQLWFSSAAHKALFERNPEKYWPALNGTCPIKLAEEKVITPGSPQWGAVYRGKLWLFSTSEARLKFAQSPQSFALPGVANQ